LIRHNFPGEGLDDHLDESQVRMGELAEGCVTEINDAPLAHQAFGRPTIGYGNHNAARMRLGGNGEAEFGPQRIKPGRAGQFIGIKSPAVSHQTTAMILAVP
jgi:hypothetical protein